MIFVDANVILRYMLNDNVLLSPRAKEIVDSNEIFVTTEVLAEVVYVLNGVYGAPRKDIQKSLYAFFNDTGCGLAKYDVIVKALEFFSGTRLDFIDCILAAYSAVENEQIATFDNKLKAFIDRI